MIYLAGRRVDDKVSVRSAEVYGANIHCISSIFEDGRKVKPASWPFMTFWTLPVDDDHCINFFVSHVGPEERMPFEKRRPLEIFGQCEDRPYRERQWIPGDHERQVGQGPMTIMPWSISALRIAALSCFAALSGAAFRRCRKARTQKAFA